MALIDIERDVSYVGIGDGSVELDLRGIVREPPEAFYYYRGNKLEAIRSGKWKLRTTKETELYDLESDIGEKHNRADEHSDIVQRLTAMMEAFDRDMKANARPAGRVTPPENA